MSRFACCGIQIFLPFDFSDCLMRTSHWSPPGAPGLPQHDDHRRHPQNWMPDSVDNFIL